MTLAKARNSHKWLERLNGDEMLPRGVWIPENPMIQQFQRKMQTVLGFDQATPTRLFRNPGGGKGGPSGKWPYSNTIPLVQRPGFHMNSMTLGLQVASHQVAQDFAFDVARSQGWDFDASRKRKGESNIEYEIRTSY